MKRAILSGRMALAAFAAALVLSFGALAQEVSQTHLKAAREAIAAIKATDQFDGILPQAAAALKQELIRKDPHLEQLIVDTVDKHALALASRRADLEREAALAYARVFSEEELRQIAEFYNSPTGQKLISDGPIVTREVLQAAEIWQTGIARDLAEAVAKELEDAAGQGEAPAQGSAN
jgi:hypothetical protein